MKQLLPIMAVTLVAVSCQDGRGPTEIEDPVASAALTSVPPIANPGGPYFSDGTIRFDGSGSPDPDGNVPLAYAWDFGDGNTGSGVTPTHTFAGDGIYVVTLTVTDATGNPSAPTSTTATITNHAAAPVVLAGAGNISKCTNDRDEASAQLLDDIPGWVVALGDNAFPDGLLADYQQCYDPTWGRHRSRTFPVLGNHEYDTGAANGTFDYFEHRAGPRGLGYYSIDVGEWHVIVLNDNASYVPFAAGSDQEQWLADDLANNTKQCTIALWHTPLFLSSNTAGYSVNSTRKVLWDRLYAAGAEIVLNGQEHHYERMAPMDPDGVRDGAAGIRQFNVGTGGESIELPTVTIHPHSEVRADAYGVLELTLRAGGYVWEFIPIAGETFTDSGSGTCH